MPEDFHDHPGRDSLHQHHGCGGVPGIVESGVGDVSLGQECFPAAGVCGMPDRPSVTAAEHQVVFLPVLFVADPIGAFLEPYDGLLAPVLLEFGKEGRWNHDGPA
ncbi:hypothetical protein BLJ79_03515 [Arthrobacter sp. UCD-GKA]|nr:hypothetical protein BLJ79_03515 [Arthrobacter sp. UCD-GKA]